MNWKLIERAIPEETLTWLKDYTLKVKLAIEPLAGQEKPNGSGVYWKGLDMASQFEYATTEDNAKLFSIYSSEFMFNIIQPLIPEPWLFNDQIVVKLPGENQAFEPHRDNQFGPYPEDGTLKTYNCMLILDDYTDDNGAIEVLENKKWKRLYPKAGDVLIIEGNCLHQSGVNYSSLPRRAYICVYSDRPIGTGFQAGFYAKPFKLEL